MPAEKSLAAGDQLDASTWETFVQRLRHDCRGEGVNEHCTADAVFVVESRRIIYGIDPAYTDDLVITCDDCEWFSPQEYWDDADEELQAKLNEEAQENWCLNFLDMPLRDQYDALDELDNHTVTGWVERWETVNFHFTKDAAEAFIRRKKHDYPKGLRVCVEAQTYCWEYNAIKEAIMDGRLILAPAQAAAA